MKPSEKNDEVVVGEGTKIPAISREMFGIFVVFQTFKLLMKLFLVEPSTMLCGTLGFAEHCLGNTLLQTRSLYDSIVFK
jgi:hypothetical protein